MKNSCNNTCTNCSSYIKPGIPCVNCENGTVCQETYNSSCVIYTGDCLECYGVESGQPLNEVILVLLDLVFPECRPTTTTTTTIVPTTTSTTTTSTTTVYTICDVCP